MTSPELILVADDEEARRARDALSAVVPTDERILEEVRARAASRLRLAPPAVAEPVPGTAVPGTQPSAPIEPEPVPGTAVPGTEQAAPARRRLRPVVGLAALVPVAVAGLALGLHWNPFAGSSSNPTTVAATTQPTPPPRQVGTATSAQVTTAPAHTPPANATTHHTTPTHPATTAPARTTAHRHTTTHARARPAPPAKSTAKTPTATHPKTTPRPARTTKPKTPTITPSRVFAWPAAPNASFYLVRFLRDGTQVFERRVTEPRLTLPASFRFRAGSYRWTVVPALGTAKNPKYAAAIIDSRFNVAA